MNISVTKGRGRRWLCGETWLKEYDQVLKVNIPTVGPSCEGQRKVHDFCSFPTVKAHLESSNEETSGGPQFRVIWQYLRPIFFILFVCCFYVFFYLTTPCVIWDLVFWPGIKLVPLTLAAQSLIHWTIREVHWSTFFKVMRLKNTDKRGSLPLGESKRNNNNLMK